MACSTPPANSTTTTPPDAESRHAGLAHIAATHGWDEVERMLRTHRHVLPESVESAVTVLA